MFALEYNSASKCIMSLYFMWYHHPHKQTIYTHIFIREKNKKSLNMTRIISLIVI